MDKMEDFLKEDNDNIEHINTDLDMENYLKDNKPDELNKAGKIPSNEKKGENLSEAGKIPSNEKKQVLEILHKAYKIITDWETSDYTIGAWANEIIGELMNKIEKG